MKTHLTALTPTTFMLMDTTTAIWQTDSTGSPIPLLKSMTLQLSVIFHMQEVISLILSSLTLPLWMINIMSLFQTLAQLDLKAIELKICFFRSHVDTPVTTVLTATAAMSTMIRLRKKMTTGKPKSTASAKRTTKAAAKKKAPGGSSTTKKKPAASTKKAVTINDEGDTAQEPPTKKSRINKARKSTVNDEMNTTSTATKRKRAVCPKDVPEGDDTCIVSTLPSS